MIEGKDMTGVPPYRRHLGMVFQNYALFPHLSVFENVAFGLRIRGADRDEIAKRVTRALEMVRLGGLGERYPKQLSGGQQQRVALARALVYEPRVLLLDEPLSNLDAKLRVEMRSEIRNLQRELGVTALYVTHDQEEALSISDRIVVMNQGRIEQISSPWDLYNHPRTLFVASFVGTANVLPARPSDTNAAMLRVADAFDVPCPPEHRSRPGTLVVRPEGVGIDRSGRPRQRERHGARGDAARRDASRRNRDCGRNTCARRHPAWRRDPRHPSRRRRFGDIRSRRVVFIPG